MRLTQRIWEASTRPLLQEPNCDLNTPGRALPTLPSWTTEAALASVTDCPSPLFWWAVMATRTGCRDLLRLDAGLGSSAWYWTGFFLTQYVKKNIDCHWVIFNSSDFYAVPDIPMVSICYGDCHLTISIAPRLKCLSTKLYYLQSCTNIFTKLYKHTTFFLHSKSSH